MLPQFCFCLELFVTFDALEFLSGKKIEFHLILLACTILKVICMVGGWVLPVLSCPILSYPVLSCPILSYPVLSCPILSYPVLSCPILSYLSVLSCPILSYPVLSCPILSYPVLLPALLESRPASIFLALQRKIGLTN